MKTKLVSTGLVCLGLLSASVGNACTTPLDCDSATEWVMHTIDFESYVNGSGDVVDLDPFSSNDDLHVMTDQYKSQYGLTMSAKLKSNGVWVQQDLWLFDTENAVNPNPVGNNGGDPDLAAPFFIDGDTGNTISGLGNVMIIQEDTSAGAFPDDSAKGGRIVLRWDQPVLFNDIVLLDMDSTNDVKIRVFDLNNNLVETKYGQNFGDNSYQKLIMAASTQTRRVVLDFQDSGAIGSFSFSVEECIVPEPATVGLLAVGMLGFVFFRRRKSVKRAA